MRKANARIDVLGNGGCVVSQPEGHRRSDQRRQQTKNHAVGTVIHHGAGQHKAPIVPNVHIQSTGEAGDNEYDIQCKHADKDQWRDGHGPGKGTGYGPPHIDDIQAQIELFNKPCGNGPNVLSQQVHNHKCADEPAAHCD